MLENEIVKELQKMFTLSNQEVAQNIVKLVKEVVERSKPGTSVVDWEDFKSPTEEAEYIGYRKGITDFTEALLNELKDRKE